MANYNKQKTEKAGVDADTVDYYTLGAQYKFNKSLRVIGEYRIQNMDDQDYAASGKRLPIPPKTTINWQPVTTSKLQPQSQSKEAPHGASSHFR